MDGNQGFEAGGSFDQGNQPENGESESVNNAVLKNSIFYMLVDTVFMKRIRDLGYERIYSDEDLNAIAISTLIYSLDEDIKFKKEWVDLIEKKELQPSPELRKVAKTARMYSTNLWFLQDDKVNLDNLIKCGEATFCYEMLTYLLIKKLPELGDPKSAESKLFQKAKLIWKELMTQVSATPYLSSPEIFKP